MTHWDVRIVDGAVPKDSTLAHAVVELPTFRVVVPLFKRGRSYEPGDLIDLHPDTAARFIALGEIEET